MVSQKVNGASLKQAVEEFGSLQKAINSLKTQKKTLQTDLLALTRDIDSKEKVRVKYLDDLNNLKKTIEERKQNLDDLEKAFKKYRQDADEFIDNNKQFILQCYMVEGFVAMLRTSPSTKEDIKELAINILMMGEVRCTPSLGQDRGCTKKWVPLSSRDLVVRILPYLYWWLLPGLC